VIPDEAVEAALEVFWDKEDLPYMEAMRAAHEAAAPHLQCQLPHLVKAPPDESGW